LSVTVVLVMDRQNIRDFYLLDVAFAPRRLVFLCDIVGERDLRVCNFILSKCCGDLSAAVKDDPRGSPKDFLADAAPWSEPETGAFASRRHASLIRWI